MSCLLWAWLLLELLLLGLELLLLGLELLLLGNWLPPSGIKVVWPPWWLPLELLLGLLLELLLGLELLLLLGLELLPRLEPRCLLLELLLLLRLLLEGVEPVVGLLLRARLLKQLLPLLLPPLCLKLLPTSVLGSLLLGDASRLGSLAFTLQLVVDHLGEGVEVEGEEHLEGVRLAVVGQAGELGLGVLLEVARQGEELLVEGSLLGPGETLPRGWVGEGLESELLVLKLLGDGLPLSGGEHQLVRVAQVNVAQVGNQGLPCLAREPWGLGRWRGRGGRGGGGGGLGHSWDGGEGGEDWDGSGRHGGGSCDLGRASRHLGGLGEAGDGLLYRLRGAGGGDDDGGGGGGDDLGNCGGFDDGGLGGGGGGGLHVERRGGICGGCQEEGTLSNDCDEDDEETIVGDDRVGVGESVQAHQEELHLEPPLCLL